MKRGKLHILTALFILIVLIFFGTWFFSIQENWSYVDSFYFTVMTITSVGYGDFVPTHDISKIATAIFAMFSIPIVVFVLGVIAKTYFERRISSIERRMSEMLMREKVIEKDVEELDEDVKEVK